jgi:RNA polymerase sigma-70 factor (ECF subfamily)
MAQETTPARQKIDEIYRTSSRRVFATLVRLLGDFDLAEEAMHEAFAGAIEQWPEEGMPANPIAWLVSAGRFKAIDAIRRRARQDASLSEMAEQMNARIPQFAPDSDDIPDDRLRLIFTCCHPALPAESHVPLTLREVCGLTTEEIARAFLASSPTIAQRIVRAKAKIKAAGIPYEIPSRSDMPERLEGVLYVIYLMFSEGYSASAGDSLTRPDLSQEAIRLGRLLSELLPEPEVTGLLAMMLLQESRRAARTSPNGELILLENQNRSLWDRKLIDEGLALTQQALESRRAGPYALQAAIAAVHCEAAKPEETDWAQIVALYDVLLRIEPSPIVELNRAVAVAMHDGPAAGIQLVDEIFQRGDLLDYHLAYAAKADLHRRLGEADKAEKSYRKALELAKQEPERRFLEQKLRELSH